MKILFRLKQKEAKFLNYSFSEDVPNQSGPEEDPKRPLDHTEKAQFWEMVQYIDKTDQEDIKLNLFCTGDFAALIQRIHHILNYGLTIEPKEYFDKYVLSDSFHSYRNFKALGFSENDLRPKRSKIQNSVLRTCVNLLGDKITENENYTSLLEASEKINTILQESEQSICTKLNSVPPEQRIDYLEKNPAYITLKTCPYLMPDATTMQIPKKNQPVSEVWKRGIEVLLKKGRTKGIILKVKEYLETIQARNALVENTDLDTFVNQMLFKSKKN